VLPTVKQLYLREATVDCSTSISWESVHNISRSLAVVLILTSFYLESFIWPDAISGWIQLRVCIALCANDRESAKKILGTIRQAFRGERVIRKRKVQTHRDRKGETAEEQSQEHAHHILLYEGDCSQRMFPDSPNN
jgi:hypothetical protein